MALPGIFAPAIAQYLGKVIIILRDLEAIEG
jgi:hypothetical protein